MPFGGGAGDIVNGLKLCKWIYDNHFIKSRTADKRYIDFLKDVKSLQSVLESLKYADPEFVDPVYQDIAGDFHKTLKTCKEFLEKHKKLEKEPARLSTNVIWGLYTKDDVDSLRDKLQFHVRTLNLLVAAQTRQDVSELVERSRPGAQSAEPLQDPVPAWLKREFQERIAVAAPFTFKTLDDIPLGKGCSALLRHFDRLSDESGKKETGSQLALEYLGLLKCHWLIEVLRNGKGFKSRPVGSPARRLISDLHEKVSQRLLSRTLHALLPATDDELWSLENDNQAFHIWEIPKEEFKISPWEAEEGEEKILTVLLTKGEKLVFIRTDTTGMRIVPIMETPNGRRRSDNHAEIRLNMDIDKFIPRYTVTKPGDKLVAEIHQKGFPVVKYELHNMEVACQVQRAITGYQVSRDESNVDWSIQWPWTRLSGEENMSGRAHIWEWNPLTKDSAVEVPTASIYTPSIAGSQISVLLRQTELPNGQGKHRQLQPPVPPALVLFSQDGPKPTYVHLDLTPDLTVDPESCHCHDTNGQCRLMVIVHGAGKKFKIRRVTAEDEGSLKRWDMSPLRGPIHPDKYTESSRYKSCVNLCLEFRTVKKRAEFQKSLYASIRDYDEAEVEYARLWKEEIRQSNRPRRTNSGVPRAGSSRESDAGFGRLRGPA